jgi:DNA polymerase elongation subunit (family B)
MTICGYTSRNIPDPKIYEDMLEKRMKAKKSGDMVTANALKLVANTTYGATLNKYNDLFDPLMARSVCITGQLFLLELTNHLRADVKTLEVIQLNTDGIMISFDDSEYDKVLEITKEWQERTGFELEEDRIKAIIQKDVNGYVEIPYEGKPKIKGGYLVRGIAPAGAFNINNNATIVAKAIVDYFVNNTPVEETINNCNDIFEFQIIAKAGAKYKEAYHLVDGEKIPVQKVNRIYATADERYGKIYKVKAENDMTAKIESLPEHCIIDNDNQLTIDKVDKTFYIDLAKKRINDFLGIKPEKKGRKKMAEEKTKTTAKTQNVYQKLLTARVKFLASNPEKSGKNMHLAFKYFELDDIVPIATKIFDEVGLLPMVYFESDRACMHIVNTDGNGESVFFQAPVVTLAENKGTNAVQAYGATMTYYRRYLYMLALDICEPDEFDADTNTSQTTTQPTQPTQKPLTASDGNASEIQIKQLKEVLKKLKKADPSTEEWMAQLALDTNGFKVISKAECEKLTKEISEKLSAVEVK